MKDVVEIHGEAPSSRASEALEELKNCSLATDDLYFCQCDLLAEINEQRYYVGWGYTQFADWVDAAGLDFSSRSAFYMVGISKTSSRLGIDREALKAARVSKLKIIFTLDPNVFAEEIKALVAEAPMMSLDEVKAKVAILKAKDGEEPALYLTLKLSASIKETVTQAFDYARQIHGGNEEGDISDSRCMEILCVSFLQTPPEQV